MVYTRKTDKQFSESLTQDLQARADIANKAGGDLFIFDPYQCCGIGVGTGSRDPDYG